MADQPTTPNLGNITQAAWQALPDWNRVPVNIPGKDDTFATLEDCVVALLYRIIRDNFDCVNEAFACRKDTPLSDKIQDIQDQVQTHWLPTDHPAKALRTSDFVGLNPTPNLLWSCDGEKVDDVGDVLKLNPPGIGTDIVYSIVVSKGSLNLGSKDQVYGLRNHASRWYFADDNAIVKTDDIAFMASYQIPEWPQDTVEPIVLAKVSDYLVDVDVGVSNRIGFEFGLGPSPTSDVNSNERDYVMYLRWYDSGDVEQRSHALFEITGQRPVRQPISITPGRRITLGFHRYDSGGGNWNVKFYINGLLVATDTTAYAAPDIASGSDIRLHIGSSQLGKSYVGGPVNNAVIWNNLADDTVVAGPMLGAYLRGEGFEVAP